LFLGRYLLHHPLIQTLFGPKNISFIFHSHLFQFLPLVPILPFFQFFLLSKLPLYLVSNTSKSGCNE